MPSEGGIDLDNLAKKVVPAVHEVLAPPATPGSHLDPATITVPHIRRFFEQQVARRFPKHQISRYEVIVLPRLSRDDDPSVRLALGLGGAGEDGFLKSVGAVLEEWHESRD